MDTHTTNEQVHTSEHGMTGDFKEHSTDEDKSSSPKIVQLVKKLFGGYIQSDQQAINVLLVFTVVAIIVSVFGFLSVGTDIPKEALENPEYGLPIID